MVVLVQLEREEEVTGPVIAPLFPQVSGVAGGGRITTMWPTASPDEKHLVGFEG